MDEIDKPHHRINQQMSCTNCGAILRYSPNASAIACPYCGSENKIEQKSEQEITDATKELSYLDFLKHNKDKGVKIEVKTVKCTGCGAVSTLKPNLTSDVCGFCGTSLVLENGGISSVVKPKAMLPFKIEQKKGLELFQQWIADLWFAPNDLVKAARTNEKLKGMYLPYWTYDANTYSEFSGERGVNRTEYYTDSEGNQQSRIRTDWFPVSGDLTKDFDDVLVIATNSLPQDYTQALEPWDLKDLAPYDDRYISGFQTEMYQVEIEQGFERAKKRMEDQIEDDIKRKIGGDQQRIHRLNVDYDNITFKHILLPIWICSYLYNGKVYRFLINGRTGEVQGERPYSWIKIALLVIAVIGVVYLLHRLGLF